MQQITVMTPKGKAKPVVRLAQDVGIQQIPVSQVYVHGPDKEQEELTIDCSAPQAAAFIEAVMSAPFYDPHEYAITADELMSIVESSPPEEISRPMKISSTVILQDLWLQNHVTVGYLARAIVSTLLVAYGLLNGDVTTLIIAFLFTPFLTQDLAISFGLWMRDWRLARQGALVLGLSTLIAVLSGAIAAAVMGGPIQYDEYGTLQSNFIISLLVGVVAGLDTADEAGRREFIAVAGAAQFASFPVWFGICLILGFPDRSTTMWRMVTFLVNILTIMVASFTVYVALRYRPENIRRYTRATRAQS
jgi:hypothetical protein